MDSGNSGSLQSSRDLDLASSAEEEYDSRTESISAFLNLTQPRSSSNPNPSPRQSSMFDSFSNYLDAFPRSPPISNPNFINLERPWSVLPHTNTISPYNTTAGTFAGIGVDPGEISSFPTNPSPVTGNPDQTLPPATKTGKKRSRASRRAPTTVLTTDTSNFRAMVQEFTGIPAPPFSAPSRNPARLDFLGGLKSRMDSQSQPSPSFLLRPFAQKIISSPSTTASNNNNNNNPGSSLDLHNLSSSSTSSNNFLNFQSLLSSTTPKFSVSLPMLGTKLHEFSSVPTSTGVDKVGLMEEFEIGMNSGNVNLSHGAEIGSADLPSLVSSDMVNLNRSNGNGGLNDEGQSYLRSSSSAGNYCNSQRISSCKLNFAASNTDFHVEKGSDNISRGEGMVDSWLCPTD